MKYNPAFLDEEALVRSFVARRAELHLILEIVRENTGESNQHVIIVGPRGMGKTTLALRVVAETRMDEELSESWYPIVFGEESYQVTTPGEFWLEALFHLGEQTGERRWQEGYKELRRESDEERLCQRALAQLMDFADERAKRLLMVVENLNMLLGDQVDSDEAWTLRHTLLNEPRLMLLGTAPSRFEEIENRDEAMYDLFKIVDLDPLDDGEVQALWESVTGEKPAENEVRPIQILTGGNPRLIRIISEFAADTSFRDLMENLTQLVDEYTEYFKRHLDSLSPQERKVFVALADLWDPATTREVAEAARLDTNRTSAVLGRLANRGAVTVVDKRGRTKYYQVAERMYNIYHLMRRRGQAASRVRDVVRFMTHLYGGEELVDTVAEETQELAPERREEHFRAYEAVASMTQDPELGAPIIREAGSSIGIAWLGKGVALLSQGRYENALEALDQALQVDETNAGTWNRKGVALENLGRYEEALEAYEQALEHNESYARAWRNKGIVLEKLGRYKEAVDALINALELDFDQESAWRLLLRLYTEHLNQPGEALGVARSYLRTYEHSPGALNSVGWALFQAGWKEHLPQAKTWVRRALEQEPDNANYHGTLASILGAQEEWEEALDHAGVYLENPKIVGETLDEAIDLFVAAAAAEYSDEALKSIQNSPSAEALEPMVVALKMDRGEDVTVATEIEEVATDVLECIETRREKRSE